MSLVIGLISFFLVLLCAFLGLLILIQLPKKEAGMGAAFGADATAALFGAGSGNALTSLTKWAAGGFVILCILLSSLSARQSTSRSKSIREALAKTSPVSVPAVVSNAVALPVPAGAATTTVAPTSAPALTVPAVTPAPVSPSPNK